MMGKNDKHISVTVDYGEDLEDIIGTLNSITPKGKLIYRLLQEGYTFQLAPQVINGQLSAVTILSITARKVTSDDVSRDK